MLNNNYNKDTLEAVTQGSKVGGYPSKILSLLKTTILLVIINNTGYCGDLSLDPALYNDNIIYTTNDIVKISNNCQLGFCQKKVDETKDGVVWMVLPECNGGKTELSNQKYK